MDTLSSCYRESRILAEMREWVASASDEELLAVRKKYGAMRRKKKLKNGARPSSMERLYSIVLTEETIRDLQDWKRHL